MTLLPLVSVASSFNWRNILLSRYRNAIKVWSETQIIYIIIYFVWIAFQCHGFMLWKFSSDFIYYYYILQVCEDPALHHCLHVLPDQHGHRPGQIPGHREAKQCPGQHQRSLASPPSHRPGRHLPLLPHHVQDQARHIEGTNGISWVYKENFVRLKLSFCNSSNPIYTTVDLIIEEVFCVFNSTLQLVVLYSGAQLHNNI